MPVVLGGGILSSRDPILIDSCAVELLRRGVRGRIVLPDRAPVAGAVDLARAALAARGRDQHRQAQ